MTTYIVSADVDFGELKEAVAFRAGLDYFSQYQIHPVVAVREVSVQGFSVLEFDEHRVALRGS